LKKTEFFNQEQYDFDDDKLKLLGWAGKKTATPLVPPGQVSTHFSQILILSRFFV